MTSNNEISEEREAKVKSFLDRLLKTCRLSKYCIVVAVKGHAGDDWAAYVGAVEGRNRETDLYHAYSKGDKILYEYANKLFPHIVKQYRWS